MFRPRADVWLSAVFGAMVGGLRTHLFLKLRENIEGAGSAKREASGFNKQPHDQKQAQEHDERFC